MNQRLSRAALVLAALGFAQCAAAQNVAVVNGTPIPLSRENAMVDAMAQQGQPDSPELRKRISNELINREVVYQEALRQGVANRPEVKQQIALAQQSVVISALIADFSRTHQLSDATLKKQYDQLVAGVDSKEYHLHHILVESEAQAKELIAKIKGGASFEALAKQYSKDVGSGKNGGDLDWAPLEGYVPEFSAAAAKLKPAQITDVPVHSQFGWHIIRLDGVRQGDAKVPPFEQVKAQLQQQLLAEEWQEYQQSLRAKASVK